MLTTQEVAQRLGLSVGYIRMLGSRGIIPSHRLGRNMLFREEDVEAFVQKRALATPITWSERYATEESTKLGVELWSVRRAAQELNVSTKRVYTLIQRGKIKVNPLRPKGLLLVEAESVRRYARRRDLFLKQGAGDLQTKRKPLPTSLEDVLAKVDIASSLLAEIRGVLEETDIWPRLSKRAKGIEHALRQLREGLTQGALEEIGANAAP